VVKTDIVIVGGGIAGLWIYNKVKALGYSAILLESKELGSGQTSKSQGIIHGGMKYALGGNYTAAAKAAASMPERWLNCLFAKGDIDLSKVPILSNEQYLWAEATLTAKLTGIVANIALKSKIKQLGKDEFPKIFQDKNFKGIVSSLNEIVIDVNKLIQELSNKYPKNIYKADNTNILQNNNDEVLLEVSNSTFSTKIKTQKVIFTAGNGNQEFLEKINNNNTKMQQRPLHMALVKHDFADPLFAHLLGLNSTPKITITTHKAKDGKTIWYIGGQIAEDGVNKTANEQIEITKKELKNYFSWLDFSSARFATFKINRAENFEGDGKKPDSYFIDETNNCIIAWPTKLAFTPMLADSIIKKLTIKPSENDLSELEAFNKPIIATPIWDQLL